MLKLCFLTKCEKSRSKGCEYFVKYCNFDISCFHSHDKNKIKSLPFCNCNNTKNNFGWSWISFQSTDIFSLFPHHLLASVDVWMFQQSSPPQRETLSSLRFKLDVTESGLVWSPHLHLPPDPQEGPLGEPASRQKRRHARAGLLTTADSRSRLRAAKRQPRSGGVETAAGALL